MLKRCICCGQTYPAQRSTSKFCSSSCRSKYHRGITADSNVEVALNEARDLMHRLDALSVIGPVKLRPICGHISRAIATAFEEVGM